VYEPVILSFSSQRKEKKKLSYSADSREPQADERMHLERDLGKSDSRWPPFL